jgi:hypothetical protein
MANPQIIYNPGTGPVTLVFLYPPRNLPAYDMRAVRHDNIASSGVRESILERIDNFLGLDMPWVAIAADVAAWAAFMLFALAGGQFQFFPDASQAAYTNYWLEDTNWRAAYRSPGYYSFKVLFRQVVT